MQVTLSTDINKPIDKLTALVNYTQGTPLSVSVTTFTHIAAGLAANLIKNGSVAATAVDSANQRISNLAGINILTTTPLQIIDPANANITLTPELKYGFLAGAISLWVKNNAPQYTSIAFAQLAYRDIATDGLLNGMGVDSVNSPIPLGLGTTPVTLNDYRYGIALNLVKMAHDQNNKTGITANSILSYAQLIATNTDLIFNNAATQTLSAPKVSITSYASNAFIRKTINLTGNISDDIGITSSELFIDGVSKGVILNASTPSFAIDTKLYSDGSHNIGIKTTNWGGLTTTTTIPLRVDNTPPTSTGSYYDSLAPWVRHVSGVVTDVAPVTIMVIGNTSATQGNQYFNNVNGTTPDSFGNWQLNITDLNINWPIVLFKDIVGNCATYAVDNNSGAWILISSGTC